MVDDEIERGDHDGRAAVSRLERLAVLDQDRSGLIGADTGSGENNVQFAQCLDRCDKRRLIIEPGDQITGRVDLGPVLR